LAYGGSLSGGGAGGETERGRGGRRKNTQGFERGKLVRGNSKDCGVGLRGRLRSNVVLMRNGAETLHPDTYLPKNSMNPQKSRACPQKSPRNGGERVRARSATPLHDRHLFDLTHPHTHTHQHTHPLIETSEELPQHEPCSKQLLMQQACEGQLHSAMASSLGVSTALAPASLGGGQLVHSQTHSSKVHELDELLDITRKEWLGYSVHSFYPHSSQSHHHDASTGLAPPTHRDTSHSTTLQQGN